MMQDLEVRRRYSDFYSLRNALVQLHPTLIIPPIPEKHTMADYAAKPTKAKEDEAIIDYRKRMLTSFLNRCRKMKDVREDTVFTRFLDPNASWVRGSKTLQPHYLMSAMLIYAERGTALTSRLISAQEQPQSPSARSCQSHPWTSVPPSAIRYR